MPMRSIVSALVALVMLLAGAGEALAHAGLISTAPADGTVLPAAPPSISLTYTEPVSPIGFSLIGVGGTPQALTVKQIEGRTVTVALPAPLANGSYLVSWRVTSEDGHPVNGTVSFAVGAASGTIDAPQADSGLDGVIWLVRALQYVTLFFGVGGFAFGLIAPLPPRARRLSTGLAVTGLVLVPVGLGLQGVDLLGAPVAALLTPGPWAAALASTYALTLALMALAFILSLAPDRRVVAVAALFAALAPSLSGHASTASPEALMRVVVFVHMASLMLWLGALPSLFMALHGDDTLALKRFSRMIPGPVSTLLASGLVLAVVQLGPTVGDWLSAYGVLLAAKLCLVALLLGLALWNRVRLTSQALAGTPRPLRRSIAVEIAVVLVILGLVAGWRFTPPPRVLAEVAAASAPATVSLSANQASGTLTVQPDRAGPVALTVDLSVNARAVTVELENPAAQIATISRPAVADGDRRWRIGNLVLPAGGAWTVAVKARTGDFDLTTFRATLSLPSSKEDTDMTRHTVAAVAISSLLMASPALADSALLASCPTGQSFTAGDITVTGAYARSTLASAQSAGGYLTVTNTGSAADTFTGASSPAASTIDIHQMKMNGQVMEMTAVEGGLTIPPGGTVSLDPMSYHLMMTGLSGPLVKGQCVPMVLHFARAGDLAVQFNIGGIAQNGPVTDDGASSSAMPMDMSGMSSDDMSGMDMSGMDMGGMSGMDMGSSSSMAM